MSLCYTTSRLTYGDVYKRQIPSDSWGAKVKIFFSDSKQLSYIIAFNKQNNEIRSRDFQNNSRKDDNQYLINHRGITEKNVKVIYSNGETGEQ